jgi:hypothetical protein
MIIAFLATMFVACGEKEADSSSDTGSAEETQDTATGEE